MVGDDGLMRFEWGDQRLEGKLNDKTTPLDERIQTTVDWYRNQYRGKASKGYEHREEEIALAKNWREELAKLIEET